MAEKNFGENSNPEINYNSFYNQRSFPVKSDQNTTKSSVGNYAYNDLSFYLNKNASKVAAMNFATAQNPYFEFKRSSANGSFLTGQNSA